MNRGVVKFAERHSRGQTMVEYLMTVGVLMATVGVLAIFLYTFREYGDRILHLAASEYP